MNVTKNIFIFLTTVLLFSPATGFCQKLEIFGYFEPQLMGAKIHNEFYQLSSNKLRIALKYQPSERAAFRANFNYLTYHGRTRWNILEFLPSSIRSRTSDFQMGVTFNPYILRFEDRHFLDNAYLKLSFKHVDLIVGKQQLSMGTGYAWNPTDVFNQKDLIDPTYEQPGHNAIRVDLPLGADFGLLAIYAQNEKWDDHDYLIKLKCRLSHFDFSVLGIHKYWQYTDARAFDPTVMNFIQLNTKRQIIGADLVGELFGLGIWTEYAYNTVRIADDEMNNYLHRLEELTPPYLSISCLPAMEIPMYFNELVLGIDYTFDFQTYVMAEFYHNSSAKSNYKDYLLNDWLQFFFAEKKALSRNQAYLFVQHPLTDLIDVGSSAILSLSDYSFAIVPVLNYNIFENVDTSLFLNFYFGDEEKTYSKLMGNGGMVRARVYF